MENLNETSMQEEDVKQQPKTGLDAFVFMENTKSILDVALTTKKNIILFGKGGYGKSEYVIEYLKEHGIDPYVISMGTGMTTDRLFGGLDLPAFNTHGKIEYLVENSFMNSEFVIFEELFDAPDFILEQLKDILSSGTLRNGGQVFKIKTKQIICCTNKTREEFAKNTSLKALMERFPLELEVKWNQHNRVTYGKLLETKLGYADPLLCYILEQFHVGGATISPRIALVAADVLDKCGPTCLPFIAEFNTKPEILKNAIAQFEGVIELDKLSKELGSLVEQFSKCKLEETSGLAEGQKINKRMFEVLTKMKSIKVEDSSIAMVTAITKDFTSRYEGNKKQLELSVHLITED